MKYAIAVARSLKSSRCGTVILGVVWEMTGRSTPVRAAIGRNVMLGKPIIKGTTITVELVVSLLAKGLSIDEVLQDCAQLS